MGPRDFPGASGGARIARARLRWQGSRPGQHSWVRIAQNLHSLEPKAFNKYTGSLCHYSRANVGIERALLLQVLLVLSP